MTASGEVRPETLIRWHRASWRLFWRIKSRPGRPPIPLELRRLIRRMATENPIWGEERIANELLLKLGLRVSPRTVRIAVTAHPTAAWTLQQLREVVGFDRARRYLIHDRDSIFARSLDWWIPLSEAHLRSILKAWVGHYRHGRPHMALGGGVPAPPSEAVPFATQPTRHRIVERLGVRARSVLGGLHHEYRLAPALV